MGVNYYFIDKNYKNIIETVNIKVSTLLLELTSADKLKEIIDTECLEDYTRPFEYLAFGSKMNRHIGKSSIGWTFSFQANDNYTTFKELQDYYNKNKDNLIILDDCDKEITWEAFIELIEKKQDNPENIKHAEYVKNESYFADESYLDEDGYSFSKCEFT